MKIEVEVPDYLVRQIEHDARAKFKATLINKIHEQLRNEYNPIERRFILCDVDDRLLYNVISFIRSFS